MAETPQSTDATPPGHSPGADPRPLWLAELQRAFPDGGEAPPPDSWAGVAREPREPGRYRIVTAPRKSRAVGRLAALVGDGMPPVALVDLRTGEAWRLPVTLAKGAPLRWHGGTALDDGREEV